MEITVFPERLRLTSEVSVHGDVDKHRFLLLLSWLADGPPLCMLQQYLSRPHRMLMIFDILLLIF